MKINEKKFGGNETFYIFATYLIENELIIVLKKITINK